MVGAENSLSLSHFLSQWDEPEGQTASTRDGRTGGRHKKAQWFWWWGHTHILTHTYYTHTHTHTHSRAVTIRQIGILHIACKIFTIYCCIAIQMRLLLNQ